MTPLPVGFAVHPVRAVFVLLSAAGITPSATLAFFVTPTRLFRHPPSGEASPSPHTPVALSPKVPSPALEPPPTPLLGRLGVVKSAALVEKSDDAGGSSANAVAKSAAHGTS
jgi:hypothetical protein